ncbi:MAG: DUF916 and DUF3324 domain-containing protein [Erysipelotrichales bacterium]
MKLTKHKIKLLLIFVLFSGIGLLTSTNINAKAYNEFGVSAVIPKNQLNDSAEYYDLVVKKDTKQKLKLKVTNKGKKNMVANVQLYSATTSNNGGVIYNQNKKADSSLNKPINKYVKVLTPKLSIKAGTSEYATIEVDMKDTYFDGIILGGINVNADTKDVENKSSQAGISMDNKVSFVTAIKLNMTKKNVERNLNLVETKGELIDFRTSVSAQLQNDKPILMKGVNIKGDIFKAGSEDSISNVNIKGADIAPNSNFKVVYDWNDQKLKEGKYRIRMEARHEKKVWKWDEEFEIKDANKVNEGAFVLKNNWILILGLILGVLVLLVIILILVKRRKNKEDK